MKQRVGCARALVMEPKILLMDEPFSALDVLTAENLRGEIDDLWNSGSFGVQSILLVTHNIEEAVILADRVIVFGSNPGHIRGEVTIDLPRPHNRNDPRFARLVEHLYTVMTNPDAIVSPEQGLAVKPPPQRSPFSQPLPHARVGGISGLLELLAEQPNGTEDIAHLAERLAVTIEDLLSILDAAVILAFVRISGPEVTLTDQGRGFASATILRSKELFRQQLLSHVPAIASIFRTLQEKKDKSMRADFFLDLWDEYFPREVAQRHFATAVDWGRYAELFEYNAIEGRLHLHEDESEPLSDEPAIA
jgi:NitT/TauT family transport system ATP-binding protein